VSMHERLRRHILIHTHSRRTYNKETEKNGTPSAPMSLNKVTCKSLSGAPTAQIDHLMVHQPHQPHPRPLPRGGGELIVLLRRSALGTLRIYLHELLQQSGTLRNYLHELLQQSGTLRNYLHELLQQSGTLRNYLHEIKKSHSVGQKSEAVGLFWDMSCRPFSAGALGARSGAPKIALAHQPTTCNPTG